MLSQRSGVNACTKQVGTQLDFVTNSWYEDQPGHPGTLAGLQAALTSLAQAAGPDVAIGVDEGRLLNGADGVQSLSRTVGNTYQASFDSLMFNIMLDSGALWYSRWAVNTNGLFGDAVDSVATNAARLMFRMAGTGVWCGVVWCGVVWCVLGGRKEGTASWASHLNSFPVATSRCLAV